MNAIARAQELARLWADSSRSYPTPRSAQLLKSVVDAGGLDFTVGFVDGVIRPEDDGVAAANLARLAGEDTSFLPGYLRYLAKAGKLSNLAPGVASKAARTIFGALVGNLVLDVTDHKLGPALAELKKDGSRLNLNLLGEAVLGRREADRRLAAVERLIERPDVDYVSLKVSSVLGTHAAYGFDEGLDHAVDKLYPVYLNAKRHGTFINLDMEEYKDLHLTLEAFKELLSKPELEDYRAGIVLQAYLPDAREELARLTEWAKDRRARGGAPVKVRLVKGANLSMERVDATMHGWELAVWPTKAHSDAAYLRMLDDALTPENIDAVNIGVAGQNLFTLAYGVALTEERGLTIGDGIDIEMLAGMATPQAKAVADSVGPLLYYVPVVHPDEFDVAISYLVRRLEENTTPENFMSNVFDLPEDDSVFRLEQQRFLDAVDLRDTIDFSPRRTPWDGPTATGFTNARDTDPSLPENIARARDIAGRMTNSTLGSDLVDQAAVSTDAEIDALVHSARAAQAGWNSLGADRRAEILRAVAKGLHENRDRLLEVVGSETGKAIDQGDVEVSEAIDFAMYYAQAATELDHPGARFCLLYTSDAADDIALV